MVTSLPRFWRAAPPSLDGSLIGCPRGALAPRTGDWEFSTTGQTSQSALLRYSCRVPQVHAPASSRRQNDLRSPEEALGRDNFGGPGHMTYAVME